MSLGRPFVLGVFLKAGLGNRFFFPFFFFFFFFFGCRGGFIFFLCAISFCRWTYYCSGAGEKKGRGAGGRNHIVSELGRRRGNFPVRHSI